MAARTTITLTEDVKSVLERSDITDTFLKLPAEQLDRDLYKRANAVVEAYGGKWNRSAKHHTLPAGAAAKIRAALNEGKAVREDVVFQSYYTPPAIADQLVARVIRESDKAVALSVLEPSFGKGALADAVHRAVPHAFIQGYEVDDRCLAAWEARETDDMCVVDNQDFLTVPKPANPAVDGFDRVVMNPPFTGGQDMAHVQHAYGFLKPGGKLVAIMSPAFRTNGNSKADAFREWLGQCGGRPFIKALPSGAFKEAGTMVETVILVLEAPGI